MGSSIVAVQTPAGLLLLLVIAVVIPVLVDLVTKRVASAAVKATVLLLLSLVSGLLLEWLGAINRGDDYDVVTAATTAAVTFLLSVGTFFGLTSPIGLTGRNGAVSKAVPGGLGSPTTTTPNGIVYGNPVTDDKE